MALVESNKPEGSLPLCATVGGRAPLSQVQTRVLLADSEPMILEALSYILQNDGFQIVTAADGPQTLALVHSQQPQCIVLDSELTGLSGLQVCHALRQAGGAASRLPILMTSTRSSEAAKVRALDRGADDYLIKPFGIGEFRARILALLRRVGITPATAWRSSLQIGAIHLDYRKQMLVIEKEDGDIGYELQQKECGVLRCLMLHAGDIVRREELIRCVWRDNPTLQAEAGGSLDVYIRRLREKVEDDPAHPHRILNVRGMGFTWSL